MDIIPFGDQAILVNFEQKIDTAINNEVLSLKTSIEHANHKSIKYLIPAYCSLTVVYDPFETNFKQLKDFLENIDLNKNNQTDSEHTVYKIPVCYEITHAPDIKEFAKSKNKSTEEIIRLHSEPTYQVYMLGFLPGFAYMGKLDESISAKRLSNPRLKVPKGSVGLAGLQTAIYPIESPGGWQLIGRTPIDVFDINKEDPFLFHIGDKIKFEPISLEEYNSIEVAVLTNEFDIKSFINVAE